MVLRHPDLSGTQVHVVSADIFKPMLLFTGQRDLEVLLFWDDNSLHAVPGLHPARPQVFHEVAVQVPSKHWFLSTSLHDIQKGSKTLLRECQLLHHKLNFIIVSIYITEIGHYQKKICGLEV